MLVSDGGHWRNPVPLLVAALALASGLPAAEGGPVLYRTDFEAGPVGSLPPGWASQGGTWVTATEEGTVLQQSQSALRGPGQAGRVWSDYDVEATVRPLVGQGQWGVGLVGYWDPDSGCYHLSSYGGVLALWRESGDRVQALAAVSRELRPQESYRFRLSLRNDGAGTWVRGKVWRAGEPEPTAWALAALDAVEPLRQGQPGLFTGRAAAAFSDLLVTGQSGEVLARDPLATSAGSSWYWQFLGGDWQRPAGQKALQQVLADDSAAFSAAAHAILAGWADYTVQVMARSAAGSANQGFGLSAYRQGDGACYQFGQLGGSSLFLGRHNRFMGRLSLATAPFTVNQGDWYTLKLRLQNLPEGVRLQGKAWPARAGEPAQWQVEAEDRRPPLLRGGDVGVWCIDDVCSFDDLVLRGNE